MGLGRAHGPLPGVPGFDVVDVVTYSAFLAWTVVGSVIISRRPSNRIGWLLSAAGLLVLLGSCATHYGLLALPGIGGLALQPGAAPGGFTELGPIPNPLGWEAAGAVLRPINATAQVLATALVGVAAASIIVRLRRAGGVQRQQLKWLAYAAVLLAGFYLLSYLYTRGTIRSIPPLVDTAVSGLGLVVVPAAIGVAVLRYRLYDIDRLINRTLVYGLLSVLLGLGYAASVLVFGQLAGQDRSNLAVAAGTLTIAALFSRPGAASSRWWTAASTAAATTPPRPSRRSAPACASRSTWTP
ncbi:MAG: putative two-component system sensor kinase [Actinomycetia bacterium]|nr:putative two-component system sensor kinase [Actinomycetes bacterium]